MAENAEKRLRTRKKLKDALIELCNEKPYYDITVWDICNQAQTYRSTFYRYYETKDEVLREIENEYIEDTRKLTQTIWNFHADATPEEQEIYLQELTADMRYHWEHKEVCKFLLSPAGDIYFHSQMVESIGNTIKKNYQKHVIPKNFNTDFFLTFFAAGFVSTIHEWLKKGNGTPEQVASFLLSMMKENWKLPQRTK